MASTDAAATLSMRAVEIVLALAPDPVARPDGSTRLVDDLGYDSLRLMDLTIALEEHFHLRASREDTADVSTLADVEALVGRLVQRSEL